MSEWWRSLALCRVFSELPWIAESEARSSAATCAMQAVCLSCPVFEHCADYAADRDVTSGFWAGREWSGVDAPHPRSGAVA